MCKQEHTLIEKLSSERILSLGLLIKYIKRTRMNFDRFDSVRTIESYCNIRATNEVTNMSQKLILSECEVESSIDFNKMTLSVVEVLIFLVAKVTAISNDVGFNHSHYSKVPFYDITMSSHTLDMVDISTSNIVHCVSDVIRHIQDVHMFNQYAFIRVLSLLIKLTHTTKESLTAFTVAKLTLHNCKLDSYEVFSTWHDITYDGIYTESELIINCVNEFLDNDNLILNDLIAIVRLESKNFIYKDKQC